MMKINKIFLINFFSLFVFLSGASAEGLLQIKTRAWPTQVTIGDEIKLTVQVERPRGFSIIALSPKTAVEPFEIKNMETFSYDEKAQTIKQTFLFKLTIFQLGEIQIPPIPINFSDQRGRSGQAWTEPIKIKVTSVIKGSKEKAEPRPIKGPVAMDVRALQILVMSILEILLIAVLIVKVVRRRRRKAPTDPESLLPSHERAILELGRLESKDYLSQGKTKEFYSELADILRRYLDRSFELDTLELTTFEILRDLKKKAFDVGAVEKIKELLENADLVKFAKLIPLKSASERMTAILRNVVENTKPQSEQKEKK